MSVCGGHQGWKVVGALQHGKRIHHDFTLSQTAKDGVDLQTENIQPRIHSMLNIKYILLTIKLIKLLSC